MVHLVTFERLGYKEAGGPGAGGGTGPGPHCIETKYRKLYFLK
jgi:hypothetical protein